jgi:cAMP phosphodiesterase
MLNLVCPPSPRYSLSPIPDNHADSISLDPRNEAVWEEAARKVFMGSLCAVFIECSYDHTQPDGALYGHLSPHHLMEELKVLAKYVSRLRTAKEKDREKLKRKRVSNGYFNDDPAIDIRRRSNPNSPAVMRQEFEDIEVDISPRTSIAGLPGLFDVADQDRPKPLDGLQIVITHVKDTLTDEDVAEKVLADLEELEKEIKLGCKFQLAEQGGSIYF